MSGRVTRAFRAARRAAARLDDSLAGDAIAALSLVVTVYVMFFIAGILA